MTDSMIKIFNKYCVYAYSELGVILAIVSLLLGMYCILFLADKSYRYYRHILFTILLILAFTITLFLTSNLIIFYICFEAALIPLTFIVLIWSKTPERVEAALRLLFYTFLLALPTLFYLGIVIARFGSLNITIDDAIEMGSPVELLAWVAMFLAFLVKTAIPPFHLWLVEAHVEAPTLGSILLSGLALKLGLYGVLCMLPTIFYVGGHRGSQYLHLLSLLALTYAVMEILAQVDWKKIVAYFSVVHMGLIFIGLFSNSLSGFQGAVVIAIIHSFVSPALFTCVGYLYERHETKDITVYGRLAEVMPVFSFIAFFLFLIEMAFPGTPSFIGELFLFNSTAATSFVAFFSLFYYYMFFAVFIFKVYATIFFDTPSISIQDFDDLTLLEVSQLLYMVVILCIPTLYPQVIIDSAARAFWDSTT